MIDTGRIVGFYTDAFGNEVEEYELIEIYSVFYFGKIFEEDTDGYNEHGYDNWLDAIGLYDAYGDMIHIRDNKYGVTFEYGEWN